MKRMFIKLICICMVFVTLVPSASAAIISDHPLTDEELQEALQTPSEIHYTTCTGGNGICQLYPKGWAYVYDENNDLVENLTCAWQCKYCYTVMVTSGDPKAGTIVGDYVVVACSWDLKYSYIQYVYINSADIRRCESIRLPGYQFNSYTY